MASDEVKVKISAEDRASSVFSKFGANVITLNQTLELAKKAFNAVAGTVDDFLDAQKKSDLTRQTVESLGVAYSTVEKQLTSFGDQMLKVGLDNEATELAMAKLAKSAGGDFTKGMQLARLAADLTSSGIGDFEGNVDNLQKILVGKGARALMQYKLNLDDTATTNEILAAVQKKVTQTAEEFADTVPGKIQVVREQYGELREEVGGALVAGFYNAASSSDNFNAGLETLKDTGHAVSIIVFEITQALLLVATSMRAVGAMANTVVQSFFALGDILRGNVSGAMAEFNSGLDTAGAVGGEVKQLLDNMLHPSQALSEGLKNMSLTTNKTTESFGGFSNAQKEAQNAVEETKKKVKDLNDQIADLNKQTGELESQYALDTYDTKTALSEAYVEQEKNVADIAKELADKKKDYEAKRIESVSADNILAHNEEMANLENEIAGIQKKYNTENRALEASGTIAMVNIAQVTEARRRASETEYQRNLEDIQKKQLQADEDFKKKKAELAAEVKAKQDQIKELTKTEKQYTNDIVKESGIRKTAVKADLDEVIGKINQVAASAKTAMSNVLSLQSSSPYANVTNPYSTVKGKAIGGSVSGNEAYLIGERGPELFIPSSNGSIVPNDNLKAGSIGGGIVVNITGTFLSQDAADKMAELLINRLKMNLRI